MIDIERVRRATPACKTGLHFNNAGASLMPDPVFAAVSDHLQLERTVGGYEAERQASDLLAGFYSEFAGLLSAEPCEIAYVENATRAWDMAFYGMPLERGDRILTHASEYVSNYLALLQQAERRGLIVDLVPSDSFGQIDVAAMEAMVEPRTRLIAITHVPTQGGLVNPVAAVGDVARDHGLLYLLDACQSVGQIELDVKKIGCHVLSGTGRKFLRGPRGTGFLYVASETLNMIEPPFVDLHSARWTTQDSYVFAADAKRYENWESNVAGKIGLARAVRYARELGLGLIEDRVSRLAARLREQLALVPGISVCDLGEKQCGIVSFRKDSEPATMLARRLREAHIYVSVTDLTSARIDFAARVIDSLLRASVHYFNTDAEVDRFVEAVKQD
jgi:selenocysteine lyase/cysteine desulfurase